MLRRGAFPLAARRAAGVRFISMRRDDFSDFAGADDEAGIDEDVHTIVRRRVRLPLKPSAQPPPARAAVTIPMVGCPRGEGPETPPLTADSVTLFNAAAVKESADDLVRAPRSAVDAELDEAEGAAVAEVARLLPGDRGVPLAAIAWAVPQAVLERVSGGDLLRFLSRYHDVFTIVRCQQPDGTGGSHGGGPLDDDASGNPDAERSDEHSLRRWIIGRRAVMARLGERAANPVASTPPPTGSSTLAATSPRHSKRVCLRPLAPQSSAISPDQNAVFVAAVSEGMQTLGAGSAVTVSALKTWLMQHHQQQQQTDGGSQKAPHGSAGTHHHVGLLRKLRAAGCFDVSGNGARVGPRGSLLPSELQPVRSASVAAGADGDHTVSWEVELDLDMDAAADVRRQLDGDLEEQRLEQALARGDGVTLTQDIFRSFDGEAIPAAPMAAYGIASSTGYERLVTAPAVRVQVPPEAILGGGGGGAVPRATPPPLPSAAQVTPPALPGSLMAAALSAAMTSSGVEGGWKAPAEVLEALVDVVPSFFVPVALVRPSDRLRACTACVDMVQIVRRYRFFFDARPSGGGKDGGAPDADAANLALTTTSRNFDIRLAAAVKHARAGAADRHFAWARQGDSAGGIPVPEDVAAALQAAAMRQATSPAAGPSSSERCLRPASTSEAPANFRPARPDLAGVVTLGPAVKAGQPATPLAFLEASVRRALAIVPVPNRTPGPGVLGGLSLTAFRERLDAALGFEGSDATARAWLESRGDMFLLLPGDFVAQRPLDAAPGAIGFATVTDAAALSSAPGSDVGVSLPPHAAIVALNTALRDDGWTDAAAVERRLIAASKSDAAAAAWIKWLKDAFTAKPAAAATPGPTAPGPGVKKMTAAQAAFAAKKQALAAAKAAALGGSAASAVLTPATAQARWTRHVVPWLRAYGATVWVHSTPQSVRLRRFHGAAALDDGVEHWAWRAVHEALTAAAGPVPLAELIAASRRSQGACGAGGGEAAGDHGGATATCASQDLADARCDWGCHFEALPPATVLRLIKLQSVLSLASGDGATSLADIVIKLAQ